MLVCKRLRITGRVQGVAFPTTPVSLSGPAMRLGNLVPLLSEKSNFKFRISREMANDVVFLKVDGMPLNKAAAHLADISQRLPRA